jgi:hypothetical protein
VAGQEQKDTDAPIGRRRFFFRRLVRYTLYLSILLGAVVGFWMRGAIHNRFARFPKEEAAWKALRAQRQPVTETGPWHEYRGILHAHSRYSHDCEMTFEEILAAAKSAGLDFVCLSDHCTDARADFDCQWRGSHDGKLFIPGFEMKDGLMPIGVRSGTVLSNQTESAALARQVVENGGVLFYVHPEEPRDWKMPQVAGMEIYNIHSDAKRYRGGWLAFLPDVLLNENRFPDHVARLIFKRPADFLQQWDLINATRHFTGIAGNDCHQNIGLRITSSAAGQLRVDDTSPKPLTTIKLNWFTRPVASFLFGSLEPNRELFRIQLDPYDRMARFVNTHVLASELSESAVLDALRNGRAFIGFDLVANSTSFRWWADDGTAQTVMGESCSLTRKTLLHARSPLPCRFTIVQNGHTVYQREGRNLDWAPTSSGKYRVEAELHAGNEWVPWVYVNPIQLN